MQSNYISSKSYNVSVPIISYYPESNYFLIQEINIISKDGKNYIKI